MEKTGRLLPLEHTPFPGEEMGFFFVLMFVGSATEKRDFGDDHVRVPRPGHQP